MGLLSIFGPSQLPVQQPKLLFRRRVLADRDGYVYWCKLPFINLSLSDDTDLDQSFVQDPPVGLPAVTGLSIGPTVPFGSDISYKGTLSAADLAARTPHPGISAVVVNPR